MCHTCKQDQRLFVPGLCTAGFAESLPHFVQNNKIKGAITEGLAFSYNYSWI